MSDLTTKAGEIRAGLVAEQTVAEWRAAMGGVTPGPWYSEPVETEGSYGSGEDTTEGFDSYVVRTEAQKSYGENAVVCDALNSGTAEVHEEFDEDGTRAWDEPGRCTMAWIARCSPAGVSDLLALIEQQAAELAEARGAITERIDLARKTAASLQGQIAAESARAGRWEAAATTAESERDELLCEKERLEREARADDFIIKDLTGTIKRLTAERNNSDAVNYTAERRAREAMAGLSTAESTNASQSERIAVLEAALAAEREACAKVAEGLPGQRGNSPEHLVGRRIAAAIRARSALAPLGEE